MLHVTRAVSSLLCYQRSLFEGDLGTGGVCTVPEPPGPQLCGMISRWLLRLQASTPGGRVGRRGEAREGNGLQAHTHGRMGPALLSPTSSSWRSFPEFHIFLLLKSSYYFPLNLLNKWQEKSFFCYPALPPHQCFKEKQ